MTTALPSADDLVRADPEFWFRQCAEIKTKEGDIIRNPVLRPRFAQTEMFRAHRRCLKERKACLIMLLKWRQGGGSTGAQALIYHHLRKFANLNASMMGDIVGTSDKVFEIFRYLARHDGFDWGQEGDQLDLDDDITLGNGSHYGKETAMSKNAGRGGTVQVANATEVAFFPRGERDPALAFLGTLNTEGYTTLGIMDSTPNGPFGTFYKYWTTPDNGWIKIFIPWFSEEGNSIPFENGEEREAFEHSLNDDEREERLKFRVSLEQLNWRRRVIKVKCEGDVEKFRSEYPSDDISCFYRSSRFRFNQQKIVEMEDQAKPLRPVRGELSLLDDLRVSFAPDESGSVEIYEQPKLGCRYLAVADTMTGEDQVSDKPQSDPDYHSLGIIRAGYRDQSDRWFAPRLVAHHWSRVEAYVAANIMAAMSIHYGRCVAFVEVNNCGLTMVKKLNEIGIPLYSRRNINRTAGTTDKQLGWLTNETTRKDIIDFLAMMVNEWKPQEPTIEIPVAWILEQMKKFILNKNGRPEAMSGSHDDGVLMAAIGFFNVQSAATEMKEHRRKVDIKKVRAAGGWQMG